MPTNRKPIPFRLPCFTPNRLLGNLGALAITAMLFYFGTQPFAVGLFPAPWDKLAHFIVFSAITGLLWLGTSGRHRLLIVGIVTLIGMLDEWHQASLPGRSMDREDLMVDVGAAIFTLFVLQILCRKTQ